MLTINGGILCYRVVWALFAANVMLGELEIDSNLGHNGCCWGVEVITVELIFEILGFVTLMLRFQLKSANNLHIEDH